MSRGLWQRLGLVRPELRAWALYDWANSAMAATIVTAVFPIYYGQVACRGLPPADATQRHAIATTLALTCVALSAPFLGALADARPWKKRMLATFMSMGVLACAGMFFVGTGDWLLGAALFCLANIGASGSFVFYDSLLPHVARPEEMDRVSAAGYALGYLGGGLLLLFDVALIRFPTWFGLPDAASGGSAATLPTRLAFVSVAVWWFFFSLPLFRRVREPARRIEAPHAGALRDAFGQMGRTIAALRRHRNAGLLLVAFLLYNDGILTIIRMSTIYGSEIGLPTNQLLLAILVVNFVGVPFAVLFGSLAGRLGAKRMIHLALVLFAGISYLGYRLSSPAEFFLLALLVAMVLGGTQALSRSLFASMIPKSQSSEFFALFAVAEKFAGLLGPALFAILIAGTGSSRAAVLSTVLFFVVGGLLLARVDVQAGRRAAAATDALDTGRATDAAGITAA